jgi:Family of unknown function (DUF6077)
MAAAGLASAVIAAGLLVLSRLMVGPLTWLELLGAVPATGLAGLLVLFYPFALLNVSFVLASVATAAVTVAVATLPARAGAPEKPLRDVLLGNIPLIVGVAALAAGLTLLAALSPRHLDGWAATTIMRDYYDALAFDTSGSFRSDDSSWPALLSFSSWVFGVDPLVLYRVILPPLVAPAVVVATLALARRVLDRDQPALFGAGFQCLLLLTSITAVGFQPGWQVLFSAAEDKTVAAFVLLPIAGMFFIRALEQGDGDWRHWALFALTALAVGVTHPFVAILLAMVTLGVAAYRLLSRASPPRVGAIAAAIGLLALVPGVLVYATLPGDKDEVISADGFSYQGEREANELLEVINYLGDDWFVVHPGTIDQPLLIAGGLLSLFAVLSLRQAGSQYILASTLIVALVAFNPLSLRLFSEFVGNVVSWRITWLLPAALGAGLGYRLLVDRVRAPPLAGSLAGAGTLGVILVVALVGPWTNRVYENLDVGDAPERELWDAPQGVAELAEAVDGVAADDNEVLLAPPRVSAVLPAFTNELEVVYRGKGIVAPPEDRPDELARFNAIVGFYTGPTQETLVELHERYDVTLVAIDHQRASVLDCSVDPLATTNEFLVYRVSDEGC